MKIDEKVLILKKLDTRGLIEKMFQKENELEEALEEFALFKNENRPYLTSGVSSDCQQVKALLAELAVIGPSVDFSLSKAFLIEQGKKFTSGEREIWLQRQRTENQELCAAIRTQKEISFQAENNEIKIEMLKRRLDSTRAILHLKRAQIDFLTTRD